MKINFGVWHFERVGKRKKMRHENGSIVIEGIDWENREDHEKIRQEIRKLHPTKHIHGYCPAEEGGYASE